MFEQTFVDHFVKVIEGEKHVDSDYDYRLFQKKLENTLFLTEDMKDCLHSDEKEDITGALDRLTGLLLRIDVVRVETMDLLMEKATLEEVRAWSK